MPDNASTIKRDADNLVQKGNYSEALTLYASLCGMHPENAEYHLIAGTICTHCQDFNQANRYFLHAISIRPDYAAGHYHLGDLYFQTGDHQKSMFHLKQAIDIDPDLGPALIRMGDVLLKSDQYSDAEQAYLRAARIPHMQYHAFQRLGMFFESRLEYEVALQWYQKLVKIEPSDTKSLNKIGYLYSKVDRLRKSINYLLESLAINPHQPTTSFNIAVAYQSLGDTENAIKYYKNTISLFPGHAKAHANLGYVVHTLGRQVEAMQYLKRASELLPDDSQVKHMLASIGGAQTPATASREYIKSTFDNYADHFENHLVNKLHYRTPQNLLDCFVETHAETTTSLNILDLGCGSGLCGMLFRPYARTLTGVDLSKKMINQAASKMIYDRLEATDIGDFLDTTDCCYDVILAADVFVYIGDLSGIFSSTHLRLPSGGLFIFSTEKAPDDVKYLLQSSGRYAHSLPYIRKLYTDNGFLPVTLHLKTMRLQDNKAVAGYHFVLQKPWQ